MTTPHNKVEAVEDCRDYLRTGRCKYGASCKFNHPSNVQSGGGMKTPLDPTEPAFPIRPNQPVCQYYMKHGTCKFGQACKFHHPPLSSFATVVGGNTVYMNMRNGGEGGTVPQHILLDAMGPGQSSAMMVQLLPQRPDEPDCIYFLRNGRCKYGATCRYHHPVDYHRQQRKANEMSRRQPMVQRAAHITGDGQMMTSQVIEHGQQIHYVPQSTYTTQSSRVVHGPNGPTHVVVTETPIALMPINGGTNNGTSGANSHIAGHYQQVQVPFCEPVGTEKYMPPIGVPGAPPAMAVAQDHASSSSSIASSFESSNIEALAGQSNWNWGPKRSGSGSNLSGYSEHPVRANRLAHNLSESVMNSRRNRATSFGSTGDVSENSNFQDGVVGWSTGQAGSDLRYDGQYDQPVLNRRVNGPQYHSGNIDYREDQSHWSAPNRASVSNQVGRGRRPGNPDVDLGLSRMTSVLLTMLDSPEEVAARSNPSRISSSSTFENGTSPPITPRRSGSVSHLEPPGLSENMMPAVNQNVSQFYRAETRAAVLSVAGGYHDHQQHRAAARQPVHFRHTSGGQEPTHQNNNEDFQPSPGWQSQVNPRQLDPISPYHQQPSPREGSASPQVNNSSNVGLFLS